MLTHWLLLVVSVLCSLSADAKTPARSIAEDGVSMLSPGAWGRAPKRTIVYVTKVKKARANIVKCCGKNRCHIGSHKTNKTNGVRGKRPPKGGKGPNGKGTAGKPGSGPGSGPGSASDPSNPAAGGGTGTAGGGGAPSGGGGVAPGGGTGAAGGGVAPGGGAGAAGGGVAPGGGAGPAGGGVAPGDGTGSAGGAGSPAGGSGSDPAAGGAGSGTGVVDPAAPGGAGAPGSGGAGPAAPGDTTVQGAAPPGGSDPLAPGGAGTSAPGGVGPGVAGGTTAAGSAAGGVPDPNNPGGTLPAAGSTTLLVGAAGTTGPGGLTAIAFGNSTLASGATNNPANASTTTLANGSTTTTTSPTTTTTTTTIAPNCSTITSNYTISTDKQTWANARLECQKKGMDLATMETSLENQCVKQYIDQQKQSGIAIWHALNKIGQASYNQWLSGLPLTYTDWAPGNPADLDKEHCAAFEKGKWVDAPCTGTYNYVCENFQPFDMCTDKYFVSTDKLTFENARAECQKKNMDLISLETLDENICVQRQLAMDGLIIEFFWMGLTKVGEKNYTKWVNKKPLTFTDWEAGNPAAFASEDCVIFVNNHWQDAPCSLPVRYVCESTVIVDPCENMTSKYVLVTNETKNWIQSRLACKKMGMELVSLDTPEENTCVRKILKDAGKSGLQIWHSLNKIGQPNFTTWANGNPLTYNDWQPRNPAQFPDENCAGFEGGKWGDLPCHMPLNYVCESQVQEPCQPGQFFLSDDKKTFDDARAECQKKKMDLVSLTTREDNICAQRLIAEAGLNSEFVYMGLTKTGESNYTKWVNKQPLTYTDWDIGNPASFGSEDCAMFHNHHWHDVPCSWPLRYICASAVVIDPCQNITTKHYLSNDSLPWGQARTACKKQGMELTSLDTSEENICVRKLLKEAGKSYAPIWFSLNKLGQRNFTHWANGNPLTYNDWQPGNPAQWPNENCAGFEGGKWGDLPCDVAYPYVCETDPEDNCEPNQYVLIKEMKSFDDAIVECKKRKMTLAVLETPLDNECAMRAILENGTEGNWVWIGLQKRGETNYTKWTDGTPLTYLDWAPNEPDSFAVEHCIIFFLGHWFDLPCTHPTYFLCENTIVVDPCKGVKTNYSISADKQTWGLARLECQKKGMDLANLETVKENNCVKNLIEMAGKNNEMVFTALNKLGQSNFSKWITGTDVTYTDWAAGQPADFANQNCGGYLKSQWVSGRCMDPATYVCETPQPADNCPVYNMSKEGQSFTNAKIECRKKGLQLAVPDTPEKNACFGRLTAEKGLLSDWVMIGLNKMGAANYTKWYNDAPLSYTEWAIGDPQSLASEHCVMLLKGHWNDYPCYLPAYYVCEAFTVDPCQGLTTNYSVSTDQLNWGAARAACKAKNMDLANIKTAKEATCIKDKIELSGQVGGIVFHSLNKIGQKSYAQWMTGDAVTFTEWATGEPAAPKTENCVAYQNGQWLDQLCSTANNYVCETPQPKDICSAYTFFISTDQKNYADAEMECLKKKMTLVSLESREENACLGQAIAEKAKGGNQVWIGLDKRRRANYTEWLNGVPLNYTDWDGTNPDAFTSEHCACYYLHHWHDAPCEHIYYYACESDYKDPCAGMSSYSVSTDQKTWSLARDECKKKNGDLVSMETPEEDKCVRLQIYIAQGKQDVTIWHSLNKLGELYFAHWANGEALTYNGFAPSYNMKVWSGEHCGVFELDGASKIPAWGDYNCELGLNYVCEFNPTPKEMCTAGQHVLHKEKLTIPNANISCQAKGMNLAVAETPEENWCIQRYLLAQGATGGFVWGGLTKKGFGNYTQWPNGAPLTYWDIPPNGLDNPWGEECLIFFANHWYDWGCLGDTWYICEKP